MKKRADVFAYADIICRALKKGVLLTAGTGSRVNTMTIGWGAIGVEWNRPVFIAYVRESRNTHRILEETGEFTVNVPLDGGNPEILGYCGRHSGRDTDKIRGANLTLVDSDIVKAPGIAQFPLTLECRIVNSQVQDIRRLPPEIRHRFYPPAGGNGKPDLHTVYYGEIVNTYLIEDA